MYSIKAILFKQSELWDLIFKLSIDQLFYLIFITKMSQAFPLDQFRDVFQITTKMKNKLQPFFAEYKNINMDWIISSLEEIHKLFFDQKLDPNIKFNTLIGIKFLFDTSEVVLINLIELYFLPKMLEIASFDAKGDEDKRGIGYFVSVGYPKETTGIEKLSYNFVRLAAEFIQAAAIVKSKKLYYAEEQSQSSDYFDAYMKLQSVGWKPYSKLAYYKQTVPTISAQFQKNLDNFEATADNYINYYTQLFKINIFKGKPLQTRLDPKKVLESGDLYVTANAIDLCTQALHSQSVKQRLQGLALLNDFMRWGDIEAAYQINCTDVLDEILNEIASTGSGINLGRGRNLFSKLDGSEQLKQQFYVQFLKAMQFWSLCFPKALKIKDRESKIKLAHDQLRMKLKMEFPDDKNIKEHKLEFDRSMQKKKNRNRILLTELEGQDPQYVSLIPLKKPETHKAEVPKHEPPKETPQPLRGDYETIKANINQANTCLNSLTQNEATLPQKIAKLKKFRGQFEGKLENAEVDNDEQLDQLFEIGAVTLQKIDKTLPHLDKYSANKLSFKDLTVALKSQPSKSRVKDDSPPKPEVQKQVASPQKKNIPAQKKAEVPHKNEVPSPQKKHQVPSQPKIVASITHIEEKPKLQKPLFLQENVSFKIQEKPAKHTDKKSLEPAKLEPAKVKVQQKPKVQPPKPKVEEIKSSYNSAHSDLKKAPQQFQVTPIKMKQSFSQLHSGSGTLPQISKKSLQKSLDENAVELRRFDQQVSIIPASHSISAHEERSQIHQNLFQNKERSSLKDLSDFSKKQPIHEDLQELDMSHNRPKNIDNVKGSYKFKPTNTGELKSPKEVLKELDAQKPKQSRAQLVAQDDDDLIMMPDDNPLQLSYHDIGGYQQQLKENKELSFKKCFEAEKYLLGAQKNTKLFWLEKDTMSLIKPSSRQKSRNKDNSISIPGILSEKDKKYQDELKYIEQQKNRKIRQLQKKISNLQTEGKHLHQKIVEQDKEIMSFKADSSVVNSRTKKNFYIEDQDQLFRAKVNQKNGRDRERSFYEDSTKLKEPRCLEPLGKLINSRKYAEYFTSFSDQKRKKNLLKNKELLFKDQSIEFGCMSRRDGDNLIITFYITPQRDLEGLTFTINPVVNSSLDISVEPKNIPSIRKRKQEKVFVSVRVKSVPYQLPQIQFVYNLQDSMCSHSFTIPCSFHKFIHIDTVPEIQFASKFKLNKNIIRGEEVPYSRKLLKNLQALTEYFSNGSLMREGEPNQNGEVEFGGKVDWQRQRFWVRIGIKLNQFICVQAVGEGISTTVEFYICLLTSLLMKNIQFSQTR